MTIGGPKLCCKDLAASALASESIFWGPGSKERCSFHRKNLRHVHGLTTPRVSSSLLKTTRDCEQTPCAHLRGGGPVQLMAARCVSLGRQLHEDMKTREHCSTWADTCAQTAPGLQTAAETRATQFKVQEPFQSLCISSFVFVYVSTYGIHIFIYLSLYRCVC